MQASLLLVFAQWASPVFLVLSTHIRETTSGENYQDTCTSPNVQHVRSQSSRECHTFNSSPCLCVLNDHCKYEESTAICTKVTACKSFDHQPFLCQANHCSYDCGTGSCVPDQEFSDCSNQMKCDFKCFDICSCRISGCEYDTKSGACRKADKLVCTDSLNVPDQCGRQNGIYVRDGTFCKKTKSHGNCEIEKTLIAVNINGQSLTDTRGIVYDAGINAVMIDNDHIAVPFKKTLMVDDGQDVSLYETGIYGNSSKRKSNRCVSYNFTICEEGVYELSVKSLQLAYLDVGEQLFNIKIGDQIIVPEVDIRKLSGGHLQHVELLMNLHVTNNHIIIPGNGPIKLNSGNATLSFCYGDCIFAEGYFVVSAFYIVKLFDAGANRKQPQRCLEFNGKPWECIQSRCSYNETNDECVTKQKRDLCQPGHTCATWKPGDICAAHANNSCTCKGTLLCEYNTETHECIPRESTYCFDILKTNPGTCRRKGEHIFYSIGGVVCQSYFESGHCQIEKTLFGINFFSPDHTDIYGISYKEHTSFKPDELIENVNKLLARHDEQVSGVPTADIPLYSPIGFGAGRGQYVEGCIKMVMPTDGDGKYQLSIKTGEYGHTGLRLRVFDLLLNGQYIVQSFEPLLYRPEAWPFDLNVNFDIFQNGEMLQMEGHSSSKIMRSDKKIEFTSCLGGFCALVWDEIFGAVDPNFEWGAISLVKFT